MLAFERDGGTVEPFAVSVDTAIAAFHDLRDRAAAAGIAMATDTIRLEPTPALAQAIEHTLTRAVAQVGGDGDSDNTSEG